MDVTIADCGEVADSDKLPLPAASEEEDVGDVQEVQLDAAPSKRSGLRASEKSVRPEDLGLPTQFGRTRAKQQKRPAPVAPSEGPHHLSAHIQRAAKRRRDEPSVQEAAATSSSSKVGVKEGRVPAWVSAVRSPLCHPAAVRQAHDGCPEAFV